MFVRGGFGELRFGDVDGPEEALKVGAYSVAVGTGGLDGEIVGSQALVENGNVAIDDATKIVYYTPTLAGFQAGLAYAPDEISSGDDIKTTDDFFAEDVVSGGLAYTDVFGDLALKASVVGRWGRFDKKPLVTNVDEVWTIYGGLAANYGRFGLGLGKSQDGTVRNARGFERTYYNVGVSAQFDRFAVSFNYGYAEFETRGGFENAVNVPGSKQGVHDFILGVEVGLLPGVSASFELEYWNPTNKEDGGGLGLLDRGNFGDDAILGVARLAVAF